MAELKGLSPEAPIVTNEQGGQQSKAEYGFHLCDYGALFALAEVLQYGASRYARDNWRKIPAEEHFNHMMIHSLAYLSGDRQDDHLGHMFCRAMMFYSTAKAEESAQDKPEIVDANKIATDEPDEGKYAGLSNTQLSNIICDGSDASQYRCDVGKCPLVIEVDGNKLTCTPFMNRYPAEFRAIAIKWLREKEE